MVTRPFVYRRVAPTTPVRRRGLLPRTLGRRLPALLLLSRLLLLLRLTLGLGGL